MLAPIPLDAPTTRTRRGSPCRLVRPPVGRSIEVMDLSFFAPSSPLAEQTLGDDDPLDLIGAFIDAGWTLPGVQRVVSSALNWAYSGSTRTGIR